MINPNAIYFPITYRKKIKVWLWVQKSLRIFKILPDSEPIASYPLQACSLSG